jgi:hypothetical protein
MRRLRQWRQFAPQLNQIAIAIIPVVHREVADDLVNGAQVDICAGGGEA